MSGPVERVAAALEPMCRAFGKGDMPIQVAREFARMASRGATMTTPLASHKRAAAQPDTATSQFGRRIHDLRTGKKLSLDKLASLSGCSKSYLWELENSNPPRPSAAKLSAIAYALNVNIDYLWGIDPMTIDTAEDLAFIRRYRELPIETRAKIRAIAEVLR